MGQRVIEPAGDDALASWSPSSSIGVNTQNVFRFNTVQVPWRANCFAIYGGQDNQVEDNLCSDVVTYPGILIAQSFTSHPFAGTTTIQRNSLIRAGGSMFRQEHGALKIEAEQGPVSGVIVKDVTTMERLLDDSDAFPILGSLASLYRRLLTGKELLEEGASKDEITKATGQWSDTFLSRLRRASRSELAYGLRRIAEVDNAIKNSEATPRLQMQYLVAELTQP